MVGISNYGIYVPKYVLERKSISEAWDFPKAPGTKSVANYDEDSITMACEAAFDCIKGIDPKGIDGLFFASTTAPFAEKQNASFIATVMDMREDIQTADFTSTTSCGTTALREAYNTIKAGNAKKILVVIADRREPEPQTMYEFVYGDGAAAILVTADDGIASIEGYHSVNNYTVGPWRRSSDSYLQSLEGKHELKYGYMKSTIAALTGLMQKYEINPDEVGKAVYYSPDPRSHGRIAKAMKFPSKALVDSMFMQISNTGSPLAFQLLYTVFEKAGPGNSIILAGYGDGADAFWLKTTDNIKNVSSTKLKTRKIIKRLTPLPVYTKYLKNRLLLKGKEFFTRKVSPVTIWRDTKSLFQFYGVKCHKCGIISYPVQTACIECGSDDFETIKLQRKGKIFTFTLDHLVGGEYLQTPVPRCVIDLEGGGRVLMDMTDGLPEDAAIDLDVELTFRKVNEGGDIHNYYWKCRPIAGKKKQKEEP